jgi:hypothetical protein
MIWRMSSVERVRRGHGGVMVWIGSEHWVGNMIGRMLNVGVQPFCESIWRCSLGFKVYCWMLFMEVQAPIGA